jgi:outer membrane protein TolC
MLMNERWRFFNDELQRFQALIEAGMISPVAAVDVQTQLAEIESELRQVDEELRIVRDELVRREQPN